MIEGMKYEVAKNKLYREAYALGDSTHILPVDHVVWVVPSQQFSLAARARVFSVQGECLASDLRDATCNIDYNYVC